MSTALASGFADPVFGAQAAFRAILTATAEPGTIVDLGVELGVALAPPEPLAAAAAAVLLTLADFETAVWLDPAADEEAVRDYLRFHCGCPLSPEAATARFALIGDPAHALPFENFDAGSDEYPELGATLIVEAAGLDPKGKLKLSGPGIEDARKLAVGGLPDGFWAARAAQEAEFPRGLDLIFTCGARAVAVPRTTIVEAA